MTAKEKETVELKTTELTFKSMFETLQADNAIVALKEDCSWSYLAFVYSGLSIDEIKGFITPDGTKYIIIGGGKGNSPAIITYTPKKELFSDNRLIDQEIFESIFEPIKNKENVKKKLTVVEWCGILTTGVILVLGAVVIKDRYF